MSYVQLKEIDINYTTCFLSVIFCVVWGLWIAAITHNGAERQWFIVATISGNFFLLKSLLAGTTTVMHRYGPNDTYPCVFNMKRITYPYLLADFYDASQFEMINIANVNIEHYKISDPVIALGQNKIYVCFLLPNRPCLKPPPPPPPTQNFLLTWEVKRKNYFWFMRINLKPNWQLPDMFKPILQGICIKLWSKTSGFSLCTLVMHYNSKTK